MMHYLKVACGLLCLLVLASNVWSMSRWSESRGVYDDICYLRQAHLFKRFGFGGLDTNIARDDDHYLSSKFREAGHAFPNERGEAPCHPFMPGTQRRVIQYPPGTGFVLALFPEKLQVTPMYVAATVMVFAMALFAIILARSRQSIVLTTSFGCLALYLMINPAKASYSIAPTMVSCAFAGLLTAYLFAAKEARHRLALSGILGLIIGLSVNFRLPNLFLSSGYLLFFGVSFLSSRKTVPLVQGALFASALLLGMTPTLLANAINAGSPFSTTYGEVDALPPELSLSILWQYVTDLQFVLLLLAGVWTAAMWLSRRAATHRRVAAVTAGNLLVNLAFFLSHPVFTPYYTVPIAMLSLWSLLFASLLEPAEVVDGAVIGQAAKA
jgi:hypothetical protein